jgi:hypothetical protein
MGNIAQLLFDGKIFVPGVWQIVKLGTAYVP